MMAKNSSSTNKYGIKVVKRDSMSGQFVPVEMKLDGPEGERVIKKSAERIYARHSKVIKALANR
ncbi:hypothetical protein [Serratia symbiotica]|uniref:hypothetical protein n=1 Tax=Serratia symbiotica TaxID=138074 RepID=UPI0004ABFB13|nr:conserved hypothetical protein [Serratia symbiotica]